MINTKKIIVVLAISVLFTSYAFWTWTSLPPPVTSDSWAILPPVTSDTWTAVINSDEIKTLRKVVKVDFVDSKTLSVNLEWVFSVADNSDIKVLQDLKVLKSEKDLTDSKKIKLELQENLEDNISYSLISVGESLDTSIDFDLSGDKNMIKNKDLLVESIWIDYIKIIDNKNIEIFLNKDLTVDTFEFKMFKESKIDNMFFDTNNLNLKMVEPLTANKDYIMILTIKDSSNNDIELENSLYDFVTPEFAPIIPETIVPIMNTEENLTETLDNTWLVLSGSEVTPQEDLELMFHFKWVIIW